MIDFSPEYRKHLVLTVAKAHAWMQEEGGPNRGQAVRHVLKRVGLAEGYPWCAAWVSLVGRDALGERWPLRNTASCDHLLEDATAKKIIRHAPVALDVFLVMRTPWDAVHCGFVLAVVDHKAGLFRTIEANTDPAGGREGYGVFERTRVVKPGAYSFARWADA